MALKINVSPKDQEDLNRALIAAGYRGQRRKFHCTVGFIDNAIPKEDADSFGQSITNELQEVVDNLHPLYEVEKAAHLFGRVFAFLPTPASQIKLKEINLWLYNKKINLNKESVPENYTPHLTVWHSRRVERRFQNLEEYAHTHPIYRLTQASYVIF